MKTYDIWYVGTRIPQKLTDWKESLCYCQQEIPYIIKDTEEQLGHRLQDPYNFVVYENTKQRFWQNYNKLPQFLKHFIFVASNRRKTSFIDSGW